MEAIPPSTPIPHPFPSYLEEEVKKERKKTFPPALGGKAGRGGEKIKSLMVRVSRS